MLMFEVMLMEHCSAQPLCSLCPWLWRRASPFPFVCVIESVCKGGGYDLGCFFPPFYLKFLLVSCATLHTEEILDKTSCWIPIFLLYI